MHRQKDGYIFIGDKWNRRFCVSIKVGGKRVMNFDIIDWKLREELEA